MKRFVILAFLFAPMFLIAQKNASVSFEKWISLKGVFSPVISPDGKTIVYTLGTTDWSNNSYDSELWMARDGQPPLQLTRTSKGSSFAARFTPDSRFVSFLADRGDKTQLYIISVYGGEALQVTKDEDGINSYEWNPEGSHIAYTKSEPDSKKEKSVKERYGAFGVEGTEFKQTHLWLLNFSLRFDCNGGPTALLPCEEGFDKNGFTEKNPRARLHSVTGGETTYRGKLYCQWVCLESGWEKNCIQSPAGSVNPFRYFLRYCVA